MKYTDSQVIAMCSAPWQWSDQLRAAAKQRKLAITSVTSIVDVVKALKLAITRIA
jgi:hypothetical protein